MYKLKLLVTLKCKEKIVKNVHLYHILVAWELNFKKCLKNSSGYSQHTKMSVAVLLIFLQQFKVQLFDQETVVRHDWSHDQSADLSFVLLHQIFVLFEISAKLDKFFISLLKFPLYCLYGGLQWIKIINPSIFSNFIYNIPIASCKKYSFVVISNKKSFEMYTISAYGSFCWIIFKTLFFLYRNTVIKQRKSYWSSQNNKAS